MSSTTHVHIPFQSPAAKRAERLHLQALWRPELEQTVTQAEFLIEATAMHLDHGRAAWRKCSRHAPIPQRGAFTLDEYLALASNLKALLRRIDQCALGTTDARAVSWIWNRNSREDTVITRMRRRLDVVRGLLETAFYRDFREAAHWDVFY